MPESCPNCCVCGCSRFSPIEKFSDATIETWYAACEDCGLVLMNPRPTAAELQDYYEGAYWKVRAGDDEIKKKKQDRRAGYIIDFIERTLGAASGKVRTLASCQNVVEIGSSFGMTLLRLGKHIASLGGQAELFGVEPSEHAVQSNPATYQAIQLIGRSLDHVAEQYWRSFDLIILSHVLEHLSDPVAALRSIRQLLSDDGYLFIEVPNFYGHPSFEYAHNYCFTENSLRNVLRQAGLDVMKLEINGHDEDFPFYLSCLVTKGTRSHENSSEGVSTIITKRQAAVQAFQKLRSAKPRPQ